MSFFVLHSLGSFFVFLGIGALIVWAFKKWTPEDFKKYGMWLLLAGAVLCILSLKATFHRGLDMPYGPGGMMMKASWSHGPMMRMEQGTFQQGIPAAGSVTK